MKNAIDNPSYLSRYRLLVARVDRTLGRIRHKYSHHITCHKGCVCGCRNLSIFPVEALVLADALQALPQAVIAKFQRRAASVSFWDCPLLEDRICDLYEFRPLICRTHGFPLRTIYKGQPSIGYCRHNFKEMAAVPADAVIDLSLINDMLRDINTAVINALAPEIKLADRLTIAEAVILGCQKAGKTGGDKAIRICFHKLKP